MENNLKQAIIGYNHILGVFLMVRKLFVKLITGFIIAGSLFSTYSQTPVERHGKLSTSGPYLLNQHGQIVQLRGMSFFWSRSDWGGTLLYQRLGSVFEKGLEMYCFKSRI